MSLWGVDLSEGRKVGIAGLVTDTSTGDCIQHVLNYVPNGNLMLWPHRARLSRRGYAPQVISVTTYDIACQLAIPHQVPVFPRQNFPDLTDVVSSHRIPGTDQPKNLKACKRTRRLSVHRYSLTLHKVGLTHGEGLRPGWANRNEEGGSTPRR